MGRKSGDSGSKYDLNENYRIALWAKKQVETASMNNYIHPRRLHYFAVINGITLPDGTPYSNTIDHFGYLQNALQIARILNIMPYHVFHDAREMQVLPNISNSVFSGIANCKTRRLVLLGYIEKLLRQYSCQRSSFAVPVYVEIWLEHTRAFDVIESAAGKYNLKIVSGYPDIPLTEIWRFVRRVCCCNKPVRIFYLSDFLPESSGGITAIEKIWSVLEQFGLTDKIDFKIDKLALTKEDCRRLSLPHIPVDNKDNAGPDLHPVELDALEAASPNLIKNELEKHISVYLGNASDYCLKDEAKMEIREIIDHFCTLFDKKLQILESF